MVRSERALLAQAHENYFTATRLHADAVHRASVTGDYRDVAFAGSAYLLLQLARDQYRALRRDARLKGAA